MAANMSIRRIRNQMLQGTLAEQSEWVFEAHCGWCHSQRLHSIASMILRFGGRHKLIAIVNRLRCYHCGRPPVRLVLVHRSLDRRITLIGSA